METEAAIIGAGPAGLASSVCLTLRSIPNIILEKEDCPASFWKKHAYDRLHLHLGKKFSQLPYLPHLPTTPAFMCKNTFLDYIHSYISVFNINPLYSRCVQSASFNKCRNKWKIEAKNNVSGDTEIYFARFLIVATGENSKGFIPIIPGMDSFAGEIIHSCQYKSGNIYKGKDVLVVGAGNSGMEISYDLSNFEARTAIVVRNPNHVVTKEMVYCGMWLLTYLKFPIRIVDTLVTLVSTLKFGNLAKYGIHRPSIGPFTRKFIFGKAPVIDVGTVKKIRSGEIKVVPAIENICEKMVEFSDGTRQHFDAIVFATGYKSVANTWLKDYRYIFNEEGMPKNRIPNHWKGENRVYCVGFARNGLAGISKDSMAMAEDIVNAILRNVNDEEKE